MHEPLVSIIIPTFNRPDILPDTINNVLAQTWQNTQIIIIDNGTSEKSMEVVKSYNDDRIIYKKTKENINNRPYEQSQHHLLRIGISQTNKKRSSNKKR